VWKVKIVREHIFEKFTEDSDPIKDLGIGMFQVGDIITYRGAIGNTIFDIIISMEINGDKIVLELAPWMWLPSAINYLDNPHTISKENLVTTMRQKTISEWKKDYKIVYRK